MQKSLRLTLFGGFCARDRTGAEIALPGTKASLLLAYLALRPGETHTRKQVIGLLWSDRGESQARGSLRQALWSLRRTFEDFRPSPLLVDGEALVLDPLAVETDISTFQDLAEGSSLASLQSALALYRGELLEGLHVRDPEFEDRLRNERQRLRELAIDACIKLLDRELRAEAQDAAATTAKRLLAIDPLQEVAHRALMEHYANKGQVGLAVKQYRTCCNVLRRELDIEPDAETERLLERIRLRRPCTASAAFRVDSENMRRDGAEACLPEEKPSIAVLPFVNMSGDPEQEHFSDGITEDIITALSRLHWFFVIARNSTLVFKGKAVDPKRIRRKLGVRYVLEGSVRKSGNRLRITAELVDAESGVQHWAQQYDRELTDIFELQDDITRSVTAAIEPKLVAIEGTRTQSRSPDDLGAWELVARAMSYYGRMTTQDSKTAIRTLQQAVSKYPVYGPAHSLLAFALLVSGHVGWIPQSHEFHYAAELAHRAARLDGEDPWAFLALGYLAFTERQTDEAVRQLMRAIDLNPNFATAYGYLGWALVFDGQSEQAIRYFQRALRMSPYDPLRAFFYSGTGVAHYYAERYDEAIEWTGKAIRERPEFAAAHRIHCASLAMGGEGDEALQALGRLRKVQPNVSIAWIEQYVPYTARAMPHFLEGMRRAGLE